jgi:hypothetical protein
MIELIPGEDDDVEFLALVQRIVNGALEALDVREVFLVHVDNWFDFKWLGFTWSSSRREELCVPPFERNRVLSERRFVWDADRVGWRTDDPARRLHRFQRMPLHRRRPFSSRKLQTIEEFSKSAAFIWYSGNSITNRAGSLMLYLSGAERYSWYASFIKDEQWKFHDERQITRRQLLTFEAGGRELVRS